MQIKDEDIVIKFNDEINEAIYNNIISVEVVEDVSSASSLNLRLGVSRCHAENTWNILDDSHIEIWMKVTLEAGFEGENEEIFSGFVTHLKPNFDNDPAKCTLDVQAIDRSIILDREHKIRSWGNKKDSDIAWEILVTETGLSAEITSTEVEYDDTVTTITQRSTDMKFLQRLARRNGFEVYVNGDSAYFGPPNYDSAVQPVLSVHFGAETTMTSFDLDVNALRATRVQTANIGRSDRSDTSASVESTEVRPRGDMTADDMASNEVPEATVFLGSGAVANSQELDVRAQAIYDQQQWFITGTGEVDGNLYGHIIRPHKMIAIRGVSESYSGEYYVTHVTHRFTTGGYTMQIKVKRNATVPTGEENFSAENLSLLAVV